MENQQYDEAVDISSSESVDEADVAPVPAPKPAQSMKSGSATSGSGGGSASDAGSGKSGKRRDPTMRISFCVCYILECVFI